MNVVEFYTKAGVVSVEWVVGIVRYHGKGGGGFGSPFSFSLTMTQHGAEATFLAAQNTYTPETRRAMRETMRGLGVTKVHYERRGGPQVRKKILTR